MQLKKNQWRVGWVLALCCLLLVVTHTAQAHNRVEVGPYAIVVGWAEEPAIVGERNAVVVQVTQDGEPVSGVEAGLSAELQYAGRTFRANLNPTVEPGWYSIEVFPTVRGQYTLRLSGAIGDVAVDELIDPEEVFSAARLQFPEAQPEPHELQTAVDELTAELASTRTLAIVGIVIGILGIALAATSLIRRRS